MLCFVLGGFILLHQNKSTQVFAMVACDTLFRVKMSKMLSLSSCFIPLIRSSCSIFSINCIKIQLNVNFLIEELLRGSKAREKKCLFILPHLRQERIRLI